MAALSPVLSLANDYLTHFKKAGKHEEAYAILTIGIFEEAKLKSWYSSILKIIDEIDNDIFFSSKNWKTRLLNIRKVIQERADHSKNRLDPVNQEDLIKLQELESKTVQTVLNSEFFKNFVKNYRADPPAIEQFFLEKVTRQIPEKTKQIIERVPELQTWLVKLSKIIFSGSERLAYIASKRSVPETEQKSLRAGHLAIRDSEKMRSLTSEQFEELIETLKEHYRYSLEKDA